MRITNSMLLNLLLAFTLLMCQVKPDPDPLQDYCITHPPSSHNQHIFLNGILCKDATQATVSDFTTTALSKPLSQHVHPRASEVTVWLDGVLLVGFVDTFSQVFNQDLHAGEAFVFPKGLVHFLYNIDSVSSALAVAGPTRQNPRALFASLVEFVLKVPILEEVLKRAYQVNDDQGGAKISRNFGG